MKRQKEEGLTNNGQYAFRKVKLTTECNHNSTGPSIQITGKI